LPLLPPVLDSPVELQLHPLLVFSLKFSPERISVALRPILALLTKFGLLFSDVVFRFEGLGDTAPD
jgi:hypothetical protein